MQKRQVSIPRLVAKARVYASLQYKPSISHPHGNETLTMIAIVLTRWPTLFFSFWCCCGAWSVQQALVTNYLKSCGVPYTRVVQRTPKYMQRDICKVVNPRIGCKCSVTARAS